MYKRIIKTIINTNGLHKRKEGKICRFLMRWSCNRERNRGNRSKSKGDKRKLKVKFYGGRGRKKAYELLSENWSDLCRYS